MEFCLRKTDVARSDFDLPIVKPLAKSKCIIFKTRVPPQVELPSDEAFKEHFNVFGKVVRFHRFGVGFNGFVVFETREEAQLALSAPEHVVNGCILGLTSSTRELSIPK